MQRKFVKRTPLLRAAMMMLLLMLLSIATCPSYAQKHTVDSSGNVAIRLERGKLVQPKMLNDISTFLEYPDAARKQHREGGVALIALIGTNGKIESLKVNSSTDSIFIAPAMTAIRKVRFAPATEDGKPVKAWLRIPIHFKLQSKK